MSDFPPDCGPVQFNGERARQLGLRSTIEIAGKYDLVTCPALGTDDKPCGSALFEPVHVVSVYLPRGKGGQLEHADARQYRCKFCGAYLPGDSLVKPSIETGG